MESPETLAPGSVIGSRYRVERQLGQGGMGHVFLVQHVHTDERLALKLLRSTVVQDQATLDRFRREARTPARIDSDHVVRVTDADVAPELGNVPFLVMEYLRGEDLEHLGGRRGPMPASEVVLLLSQAARALDKAHALGIVHRDLKPENLFLTQREDGTPWIKILDFGIAKMTGGDVKEAGRLTATGQIFGTPLYMSPEQAMAESEKICPQTDVWALGLIAHRMLTGKEFWTASTLTHLVAQIAFEPIPPPSELGCTLGPAYDEWFSKCCARDIGTRYRSAGEAVAALASALSVTDLPSGLSRVPVSVRVQSQRVVDERDMLAATSASDAVTSPTATPAVNLTSTKLPDAAPKAGRGVPRSLPYVVGALLSVLAGGIAAWKLTGPSQAQISPSGATSSASGETTSSGPKSADTGPLVVPAPTTSGDATATPTTSAATAATTTKTAGTTSSTVKPGTSGTATKATATPTTTASAPPTATTATPAKTVDPYGSRR
ncbi:MAG: serine/threonine-protein kinase [Polyangiaceae bacterium]